MKKLMLLLMLPLVLAASENAELSSMQDPLGAEVRLLQLEASIERNIAHAEIIIDKATALEKDTTNLENILADFDVLLLSVQETDLNQEPSVLAEEFVILKSIAINLSKEFKDEAHLLMDEAVRIQLKTELQNRNESMNIRSMIRQKVQQYNMNKLQKFANSAGLSLQSDNVASALQEIKKMGSQIQQMNSAAASEKNAGQTFASKIQAMNKSMKVSQTMQQIKAKGSECTGDCLQTRDRTNKPSDTGKSTSTNAGVSAPEKHEGDLCTGDCDQIQGQTNKPDEPKGSGEGSEQASGDKCDGDCDQDQTNKPSTTFESQTIDTEPQKNEGNLCDADCDQIQDQTNKPDEPKSTGDGQEQSGGDNCDGGCDQDQTSKPETGGKK